MDFKQLLEVIPGESNVGCYLKDDRTVYRRLRNTFNAAQSSFRRLIETPDSSTDEVLYQENQQNWQIVNDACWQTLIETSKDVEIMCWWTMSLAFQHDSITKVAAALDILPTFLDTFWPDVQPFLPEEKLKATNPEELAAQRAELQLKPIIQLLGESAASGLLYMPLQILSLVGDIDHGQYLSATKSGQLATLKAKAQNDFSTAKEEVTITIQALSVAIEAMSKLDVWLKKTTAELSISAISTQFLQNNLSDCLLAIKYLVADNYMVWPLEQANQASTGASQKTSVAVNYSTEPESTSVQPRTLAQQPLSPLAEVDLASRDQAFQELRKIADYFSKSEPHSPVSFLIEKAIRWGYMPLSELMQELTKGNDNALAQINLITGIGGEKTDISAHVTPVLSKPAIEQTKSAMNNSTEPPISAINEAVSNTAPELTPQMSSPKMDAKSSSSTDDFSF